MNDGCHPNIQILENRRPIWSITIKSIINLGYFQVNFKLYTAVCDSCYLTSLF